MSAEALRLAREALKDIVDLTADVPENKVWLCVGAAESRARNALAALDSLPQAEPAELESLRKNDARYRWLCANNFDRVGATQVHTWLHTWEPHSQTGEPTEWEQRIRGSALDAAIDAAMSTTPQE